MKAKEIKTGEIFTIDNTIARPKLKMAQGFVDIASLYIYTRKEDAESRILTESEINRVRLNWGMTPEKFEDYIQMLIRRYIKEVKK